MWGDCGGNRRKKGTAAGSYNKLGIIFNGCCPEVSAGEEVVPAFVFGGTWTLRIRAGGGVNVARSFAFAVSA